MGDLFEIADTGSLDELDHLIFHGWVLCHASPLMRLLRAKQCMVGATEWFAGEHLQKHRGLPA